MNQQIEYSGNGVGFQATFRPHRKYFHPSRNATLHGYFPKTHWTKLGRKVIDQEQPALAVANAWQTRNPKDSEIILAWNDLNQYLVTDQTFNSKVRSRNSWFVYHESETTVLPSRKEQNPTREQPGFQIIQQATAPPEDTAPYDVETINNGTGGWLTIPKRLELSADHRQVENEIHYYCHTILQGVFNQKHDTDRSVRIKRELMRKILGDAGRESLARQCLLDNGIIFTDHVYSQGNFSKSYGMNPVYTQHLTRWEVTNPRLAKRIRLARLQRTDLQREQTAQQSDILNYLEQWAKRIEIDLDACRSEVDETGSDRPTYNLIPAENIQRRDYHLTRDDYGRVHSPFTQLWRPFRQHLRFDGQSLHETDIRNSQIVFLVKLMKEHLLANNLEPAADQSTFMRLVERGETYDHLLAVAKGTILDYLRRKKTRQAQVSIWRERFLVHVCGSVRPKTKDEWSAARRSFLRRVPVSGIEVTPGDVVRDDFKRMLFSDVFYGRVRAITPLTGVFREEFPSVYRFICEQKADGYEELARNMQRAEASLMIDTVCLRLMKHHPEIPVVTIHDSITTTAEHLPTVRRILMEEFARIDLRPTLK